MKNKNITPTSKEKLMCEDDFIVSKTDLKGRITYGNHIFIEFSGYTEQELLGAQHNIIRHPDMPRAVFNLLWDTIAQGKEIFAYVKNMAKDGSFYWVYVNVTADYDKQSNISGYFSVRRNPILMPSRPSARYMLKCWLKNKRWVPNKPLRHPVKY